MPDQTSSPGAPVSGVTQNVPAPKPIWQSKTAWLGALTAILPFVPGVGPVVAGWVGTNPEAASAILGFVFTGFRLISNGKVTIK